MENDALKKDADKVINVTYMLSGVLDVIWSIRTIIPRNG